MLASTTDAQTVSNAQFVNGITVAGNTLDQSAGSAFDPEGIVINPVNGNILVSDEFGPSIVEFNRNGQEVR